MDQEVIWAQITMYHALIVNVSYTFDCLPNPSLS